MFIHSKYRFLTIKNLLKNCPYNLKIGLLGPQLEMVKGIKNSIYNNENSMFNENINFNYTIIYHLCN